METYHIGVSLGEPLLISDSINFVKPILRNMKLFKNKFQNINSEFTVPCGFDMKCDPIKYSEMSDETILLNVVKEILKYPRDTRYSYVMNKINEILASQSVFQYRTLYILGLQLKTNSKYDILSNLMKTFIDNNESIDRFKLTLAFEVDMYKKIKNKEILSYWWLENDWSVETHDSLGIMIAEKNKEVYSTLWAKK